ncbi:MAG: acyl transferase [Bacteroidota bacterium]|nr:acyl transferase [Bacteroidota bacterium]
MSNWENYIFQVFYYNFDKLALEIFHLQYQQNDIYKKYVDSLGIIPANIKSIETIPYLPISFFKTHSITATKFKPEVVFQSSGTTGTNTSNHFVKKLSLYQESFSKTFNLFYGDPSQWCIIGLLPGYLERENSSLVAMADELIKKSKNPYSGFYLHNHEKLYQALVHNEIIEQPTLLIGVTFSLLDFAEKYSLNLQFTTIMETGGMKGRREEITREEVHLFLQEKLGVPVVHSEYGMTELLSQAYSKGNGLFSCPPWMKVLTREYNDPFAITSKPKTEKPVTGLLNIIDLANLYSCCFIATDDVGKIHKNNYFEVMGRRDSSDLRGCSLLTAGD